MKLIFLFSFLTIFPLSLQNTFTAEKIKPQIIEYKQVDGISLNLHVFYPPNQNGKHSPNLKRPAIVFFFGGGWIKGGADQFFKQSKHLASRGMVAISADYRTRDKHKTKPFECVKDAKSAVRYIRANAQKLGIDPDKLAVGGGSAGGHLAASCATNTSLNEKGDNLSISCIPNALVLFNPVIDNGPGGYGHDRVRKHWQTFSPLHNIPQDMPPTLFMLGTKDKLIPVSTGEAFQKKLQELSVRCDLKLYEGKGHGFFNKDSYDVTLEDMDAFLTSLGYLPSR